MINKFFVFLSVVAGAIALFLYQFLYDPRPESFDVSTLSSVESNEIATDETSFVVDSAHEGKNIIVDGNQFKAPDGRSMFLRGINLGGTSKMPFKPYMVSHIGENFFDGENISFVGRPFPLEQADEHFTRLKTWGFHFVRLLVTWEAIEHHGPGIYDKDYLDYLKKIVLSADEHGLNVFIDPHQDVWSRYSGGSGAPLWTFTVAGLNPEAFSATGAALVHNIEGDPLAKMIWYTNNSKLAAATMWTLFFAGNDFAPKLTVVHETTGQATPIQDYLQDHFNNAMEQVAVTLQGLPNVIGFEYINEPASGYIGLSDLNAPFTEALFGDLPSPAQGMYLAAGYPQTVETAYIGMLDIEQGEPRLLNQERSSAWLNGDEGIWQQHGVWHLPEGKPENKAQRLPQIKKGDYFTHVGERQVDFSDDYLKPAIEKYRQTLRNIDPQWTLFISPSLFPNYTPLPVWKNDDEANSFKNNTVNAKHWYDDVTLAKKQFMPFVGLDTETNELKFGVKTVREFIEIMLGNAQKETLHSLGEAPTLIGETGIPYDMNDSQAYQDGDFSEQEKAADRVFNALEKNLLHYTWWNYTADNTNARGDQWNGEDLSIFSVDQQSKAEDIDSGGRALSAIVRPYPYRVAGRILEYRFDRLTGEFLLRFEQDSDIVAPSEIFLPKFHYKNGYQVFSTTGRLAKDTKRDILLFHPDKNNGEQIIVVRPVSH